jgi:hypothetical protein
MYKRVRRITSGQAVKPTESRGVGSEARDATNTICHNRISNHRKNNTKTAKQIFGNTISHIILIIQELSESILISSQ